MTPGTAPADETTPTGQASSHAQQPEQAADTGQGTGAGPASTDVDPRFAPDVPGHEKAEQATHIWETSRRFGITPEQYMLPAQRQIRMLSPEGTLIPEDEQGTSPGHEYPIPEDDALLAAYEALVVGRRVNDQNYALVRQGRLAVYPSSHGQEACQVGAALALGDGDWMFPTYRDTVAVITRGVDPLEVMVSFRGDWHCGYDPHQYRISAQSTPLTTQLLHAVGVAHAAKLRGEDTVVLAMCGDGATSEGDFHEALNFAAVFEVPVVFFVQNNGYAISVPLSHQTAAPSLAHKAIGYGMAGEQVDGNDMVAVLATLRRAVDLAREHSMPLLLEATTYRMQAHTNADDDTRYRDADEVALWKERDPLLRMKRFLSGKGVLDDAVESRISATAEEVAASLRQAMTTEPDMDPLEIFDHVYSAPTAQLREQRALLADELERSQED
ncbi:pyruvate dehydrogenase (acetyl-transferring) E1 component subunit alpha [Nesterenkonia suensis]